jgi:hypothetical protein
VHQHCGWLDVWPWYDVPHVPEKNGVPLVDAVAEHDCLQSNTCARPDELHESSAWLSLSHVAVFGLSHFGKQVSLSGAVSLVRSVQDALFIASAQACDTRSALAVWRHWSTVSPFPPWHVFTYWLQKVCASREV